MQFKNIQVYRLSDTSRLTKEVINAALATRQFAPISSNQMSSEGWFPPTIHSNGELAYEQSKSLLIALRSETKILPQSVINDVANAKADDLEEAQGFRPGRKAMKELKERVADELLPRAFSRTKMTYALLDLQDGFLLIDTPTPSKADDVIKMLLACIDKLPLESLRVKRSPIAVMTGWLETDEAPAGFTIDQDADLMATGESKAKVKYVHHTLDVADVRRHIAAGKQCTRLAMTWQDKVSFVLTESLAIKRISFLDILKENEAATRNDEERFDNDLTLTIHVLRGLVQDVIFALGGDEFDLAEQSVDDPLYEKAVTVVRSQNDAGLSVLQNLLMIGYNRACRLLDRMERDGVVTAIGADGNRTVVVA